MTKLSEGATKLAEVARKQPGYRGKEGSIRNLARVLGFNFPTVYRWIKGERVPEYLGRKRILEVCGVPIDDWDVEVSSKRRSRRAA